MRLWLLRQHLREKKMQRHSDILFAARKINTSWRSYKKRLATVETTHRLATERRRLAIRTLARARETLAEKLRVNRDQVDSEKASLEWTARRMRELRIFDREAARSIPKIVLKTELLGEMDVREGWKTALQNESQKITNQRSMAWEELRCCRVHVARVKKNIHRLQREQEELFARMDAGDAKIHEISVRARRAELRRAADARDAARSRKIRAEVVRWKVTGGDGSR
uniref:Uncharacterized protein n=2 Tax=Corethron hystrix TaxID=216773 RepID=A0A7S1FQ59_9STRA|mmetsp:Transcript_20080/g.45510  ORF Transcript_20080/g.45510 Transcript_20080/m.45510 type:complete len:226 (+) Transcript_20080:428-1105(+)